MQFVDIEGEIGPTIMYKPYVYKHIIECSNHFTIFCSNKDIIVRVKDKEFRKEIQKACEIQIE